LNSAQKKKENQVAESLDIRWDVLSLKCLYN